MPNPNTWFDTAIDVGVLPAEIVANPEAQSLYYKVTAPRNSVVLGVYAKGISEIDPPTYFPDASVFTYDILTDTWIPYPVGNQVSGIDRPIQFQVTVGEVYYLQINTSASIGTATLILKVDVAPNRPSLSGDILMTDMLPITQFPAVILQSNNGRARTFQPFLTTGNAVVQGGGNTLDFYGLVALEDSFASTAIYNAELVRIKTLPIGGAEIGTNKTNTFYVGFSGSGPSTLNASFTIVNCTGPLPAQILQGFTYNLPTYGLKGLNPSKNELVVYTIGNAGLEGDVEQPVKRFGMLVNEYVSDLANGYIGCGFLNGLIVLDDESVIVGYYKVGDVDSGFVVRFDANGNLLNVYFLGVNGAHVNDRIARGLDDTSFWVRTDNGDGTLRIRNIRIVDGGLNYDYATTHFTIGRAGQVAPLPDGAVNSTDEALSYPQRFGPPPFGSFVILRYPVPGYIPVQPGLPTTPGVLPPGPVGGIYYLDINKKRTDSQFILTANVPQVYVAEENAIPNPFVELFTVSDGNG